MKKNNRHTERNANKKDRSLRNVTIWILATVATVLIISSVTELNKKVTISSEAEHRNSTNIQELQDFWYAEVHNLIAMQLATSRTPYPEINDRFMETFKMIKERTGKPLDFSMCTAYHWATKNVEAGTGMDVTNNLASVQFYVPSMRDTFIQLRSLNIPNFRDAFKAHVLIITMHELEHLRVIKPERKHIDLTEESRAWADTCRYIIDPLVRVHGVRLSTDLTYYNGWLESGGDTNHPAWKKAIKRMYGAYDGMDKNIK